MNGKYYDVDRLKSEIGKEHYFIPCQRRNNKMSGKLYRMTGFNEIGVINSSSVLTEEQVNEILEKRFNKYTKRYIVVATSWSFGVCNLYYTGKMFQLEGVKYPQLVEEVTKAKRYTRKRDAERVLDKSLIYNLEVYTLYVKIEDEVERGGRR